MMKSDNTTFPSSLCLFSRKLKSGLCLCVLNCQLNYNTSVYAHSVVFIKQPYDLVKSEILAVEGDTSLVFFIISLCSLCVIVLYIQNVQSIILDPRSQCWPSG